MALTKLKWLDNDGNEGDKSNNKLMTAIDNLKKIKGEDLNSIRDIINAAIDEINKKVDKVLSEGTHWSTETELKALLVVGELVNIKTLTKGSVTGIVTQKDVATKITMNGYRTGANQVDDGFGGINLEFEATGKIFLINVQTPYLTQDDANTIYAKLDLSNVNVGAANAGKLLKVKADGGIEYEDESSGLPAGYTETVLFPAGTSVGFPLTVTPNATLWEVDSSYRVGDTQVQSNDATVNKPGHVGKHRHIGPLLGFSNDYNKFGASPTKSNTGYEGNASGSYQGNGYTSMNLKDGTTIQETDVRTHATGQPVKYYKAKIDIVTLIKIGGAS